VQVRRPETTAEEIVANALFPPDEADEASGDAGSTKAPVSITPSKTVHEPLVQATPSDSSRTLSATTSPAADSQIPASHLPAQTPEPPRQAAHSDPSTMSPSMEARPQSPVPHPPPVMTSPTVAAPAHDTNHGPGWPQQMDHPDSLSPFEARTARHPQRRGSAVAPLPPGEHDRPGRTMEFVGDGYSQPTPYVDYDYNYQGGYYAQPSGYWGAGYGDYEGGYNAHPDPYTAYDQHPDRRAWRGGFMRPPPLHGYRPPGPMAGYGARERYPPAAAPSGFHPPAPNPGGSSGSGNQDEAIRRGT
jgi:hypothetical protein